MLARFDYCHAVVVPVPVGIGRGIGRGTGRGIGRGTGRGHPKGRIGGAQCSGLDAGGRTTFGDGLSSWTLWPPTASPLLVGRHYLNDELSVSPLLLGRPSRAVSHYLNDELSVSPLLLGRPSRAVITSMMSSL